MLPSESSKQIELSRHEFRSGGVQGEKFFGSGWPIGVITLAAIVIGTLTHDSSPAAHIIGGVIGAMIAGIAWTYYR